MNKNEYESIGRPKNEYRKIVTRAFKAWKMQYHPNERCVIHHRDDCEEAIAYNEAHYERWGCEESGAFEYGRYIVFMTRSEHMRHHMTGKTGEKHPAYGRTGELAPRFGQHLSAETKSKMSTAHKGKGFSEEHKQKMSENSARYWKGQTLSEETRQKISENNACKRPEVRQKISAALKSKKFLYTTYKENGGKKSWNEFQRALASGDITFETHPVSVFVNGA